MNGKQHEYETLVREHHPEAIRRRLNRPAETNIVGDAVLVAESG